MRNCSKIAAFFGIFALGGVLFVPDGRASAEPLDESRLAQRAGDVAVLEALDAATTSRTARLRAIRQARFLVAPEEALPSLAKLSQGRDGELAAEAAFVAHAVVLASVDEGRMPSVEPLERAREGFALVASDETARADVRALARVVVAQLALRLTP